MRCPFAGLRQGYGQTSGEVTVTVPMLAPSVTFTLLPAAAFVPELARVMVSVLPLTVAVTLGLLEVVEYEPLPPTTETEPDWPQARVMAVGPTVNVAGVGGVPVPGWDVTVAVACAPDESLTTT